MLISLDNINEEQNHFVGAKAFNLARLKQHGFAVPNGAVIVTEAFEARIDADPSLRLDIDVLRSNSSLNVDIKPLCEKIQQKIQNMHIAAEFMLPINNYLRLLLNEGYSHLAVRSSSVMEDQADSSFAGQYESVLGVADEQTLEAAIRTCWASAFDFRVVNYCLSRRKNLKQLMPAVLIQGQIEAEVSGVLFTVDPRSGKDCTMLVEAVEGLGEALVQGETTPTHYEYNWYEEEIVHAQAPAPIDRAGNQDAELESVPKNLLSEPELRTLCDMALEVQQFYGTPQDIEWARNDGQFHLLQSRPIAAIHYLSDEQWTNADFKDGGVASSIPTPLMWSLYERILEETMPAYLQKVGLHPKRPVARWTKLSFGFPYWNLSAVKQGLQKIPGFSPRSFDASLGIDSGEKEDRITKYTIKSIISGLRILNRINRSIQSRLATAEKTLERLRQLIVSLERESLAGHSDNDLATYIKSLVEEHYRYCEGEYFTTVYDNSNAATLFKDSLDKYNAKKSGQLNELHLVGGLADVSHMRPVNDLWKLSRKILSTPEHADHFSSLSAEQLSEQHCAGIDYPCSTEIKIFIDEYKYHSARELDLLVPCWDEDPSHLFHNLKLFLRHGDNENPQRNQHRQAEVFNNEKAKISSNSLLKKLITHRKMLVLREEMRDQSTKMYRLIRRAYLEAGSRLYSRGAIDDAGDIFFLNYRDSLEFFNNPKDVLLAKKLNKNRAYYQSFRNYNKPNEILVSSHESFSSDSTAAIKSSSDSDIDAALIRGTPCSPGVTEGVVWVQNGLNTATDIATGTILVAPFTDPSYTLLFSSLSGLITEAGGMLSHGAVVSREYGIPAVLAINNACSRFKTGMRVRIDGYKGEVRILDGV